LELDIALISRAGFPTNIDPSGTFLVTTDPAPILEFLPILIPGKIVAFAPIATFSSIQVI